MNPAAGPLFLCKSPRIRLYVLRILDYPEKTLDFRYMSLRILDIQTDSKRDREEGGFIIPGFSVTIFGSSFYIFIYQPCRWPRWNDPSQLPFFLIHLEFCDIWFLYRLILNIYIYINITTFNQTSSRLLQLYFQFVYICMYLYISCIIDIYLYHMYIPHICIPCVIYI